jgi:3'(2'), 5'-bisphosphate nucleotidase
MPIDLNSELLLDALTAAAARAAQAILGFAAAPVVRLKMDGSPVTAADEAAEALILEDLARILPGVPVISEEAVSRGHIPALGDTFVLVDPLDGTREFIAGRPEYTVNIAVVVNGLPMVGIITTPSDGVTWRGVVGRGADRLIVPPGEAFDNRVRALPIHARRAPAEGLVAALSRSYPDPATNAFVDRLAGATRRTCGSSVKFCWLAEGTADVYPRLAPPNEWDIAAGHAILAAAGGAMIRTDGEAFRYGAAELKFRAPAFIAWGDREAAARYRA